MEVHVDPQPIITAKIDIKGFVEDMRRSFDLQKAISDNLQITKVEEKTPVVEKLIEKLIFFGVDWGRILMHFNTVQQDEMEIYVSRCTIYNLTQYKPKLFDRKNGIFTFEKQEEKEYDSLFVVHTFVRKLEHHILKLLGDNIFFYDSDKTWTQVMDLTGKEGGFEK